MNNWISVEDKLPSRRSDPDDTDNDESDYVLVYTASPNDYEQYCVALYHHGSLCWLDYECARPCTVTHWQVLPEAPEKQKTHISSMIPFAYRPPTTANRLVQLKSSPKRPGFLELPEIV